MIRTSLLVGLAVLAPGYAAGQVAQETRGATDRFGPGFTALSEARVDFQLKESAHAALIWVTAGGSIELFYPRRSRDRSERRAGRHAISVTEVPSPLDPPELSGAPSAGAPGRVSSTGGGVLTGNVERGGVGGAAEPVVAGYWVLIVSERPLVATEVTEQLRRLSRDGRGPAVLDRIAAELAWDVGATAMYVAAVAVRP